VDAVIVIIAPKMSAHANVVKEKEIVDAVIVIIAPKMSAHANVVNKLLFKVIYSVIFKNITKLYVVLLHFKK
jgi:hypothetical protein